MKKAGGDTGNGVPARLPSDERREEGSQLLLSPILLLREIPADDTLRRQGGKQCVESRGEDGQRKRPAVVHTVTNRSRIRSWVWGRWRRVT